MRRDDFSKRLVSTTKGCFLPPIRRCDSPPPPQPSRHSSSDSHCYTRLPTIPNVDRYKSNSVGGLPSRASPTSNPLAFSKSPSCPSLTGDEVFGKAPVSSYNRSRRNKLPNIVPDRAVVGRSTTTYGSNSQLAISQLSKPAGNRVPVAAAAAAVRAESTDRKNRQQVVPPQHNALLLPLNNKNHGTKRKRRPRREETPPPPRAEDESWMPQSWSDDSPAAADYNAIEWIAKENVI